MNSKSTKAVKSFGGSPASRALLGALLAGVAASSGAGCDGGGGGEGGGGAAGGSVKVQISGEDLATDGFGFPGGSEVTIADGWEVKLSHVLVSVDRVWLSDNPDRVPSDQSQTGDLVAQAKGPWIVDLSREGDAPGAGGEGTAISITTLDRRTEDGDAPLSAGERYAFSYALSAAADGATPVNLDAEGESLFEEMKTGGYAVYYVGTATFKGTSCETSDAAYDFTKIPQSFEVKLGFATPTSYLNCQNQENPGEPFDGEEYQRGVTIKEGEPSLAQMTIHLEHPFYSETQHEPALYFDQLAALLVGQPEGTPLTIDAAVGVDPSAFTDGEGASLPWRTCDGSPVPGTKQRAFDTGSVPLDPGAPPAEALRDYRDYLHYVQSTQGHMNGGEGLCFARRDYPSPD